MAGNSRATKMPMMAITTSSSTSVNARFWDRDRFIPTSSLMFRERSHYEWKRNDQTEGRWTLGGLTIANRGFMADFRGRQIGFRLEAKRAKEMPGGFKPRPSTRRCADRSCCDA